nr:probable beta-1,3-galactosyltransferase 2 isoform X2 [Tanacetum cinerariifolium]
DKLLKLEKEKGIIMRFVIGHGATSGGILNRAIEAEDTKHRDFSRLENIEGYLELSAQTKTYFTTVVALWDAYFYFKEDNDVHVNIGRGVSGLLGQVIHEKDMTSPIDYVLCVGHFCLT